MAGSIWEADHILFSKFYQPNPYKTLGGHKAGVNSRAKNE